MAFGGGTARGVNFDAATGSSLAVTPTAGIAVGALLLVRVVTYNAATSTGATSDHTGVTDTQGNTYTKLAEYTRGAGVSGDGLTASVWLSVLDTALTTGDAVTVALSGALGQRTMSLSEFSGIAPVLVTAVANHGASVSPSVTVGSLPSAPYLLVGLTGYRRTAADTESFDANYSLDVSPFDTNSGGNNARVKQWGEYRIATLTGDTHAGGNSASGRWVALLVVLQEYVAPSHDGVLKIWNGSTFDPPGGVVKTWDGVNWIPGVWKVWDGADYLVVATSP